MTYSSYAMLKLQVSLSWIISSRAAEIRSASPSIDKSGTRESLESGTDRMAVDSIAGDSVERVAVGRRNEARTAGTDFVR